MIELIKGKQDDVITKDLIRTRQLEHSMLRFTRIFQMGKGNFQRDEGSAAYSSVMSEGKRKTIHFSFDNNYFLFSLRRCRYRTYGSTFWTYEWTRHGLHCSERSNPQKRFKNRDYRRINWLGLFRR